MQPNVLVLFFCPLAVAPFVAVCRRSSSPRLPPRLTIRSTTTAGSGNGNAGIRNGLVMLQFVIATGLVFLSFVVYSQLLYMKNKDKGFRTEGIVLVENLDNGQGRVTAFQQLIDQ